jgi:hypothetical protein
MQFNGAHFGEVKPHCSWSKALEKMVLALYFFGLKSDYTPTSFSMPIFAHQRVIIIITNHHVLAYAIFGLTCAITCVLFSISRIAMMIPACHVDVSGDSIFCQYNKIRYD